MSAHPGARWRRRSVGVVVVEYQAVAVRAAEKRHVADDLAPLLPLNRIQPQIR